MPVARRRHGARARSSSGACKPGDRVKRGDIVAVVETEKGLIEVEIFESGVDRAARRPSRATRVPVGTLLATIRQDGAAPQPLRAPSVRRAPLRRRLRCSRGPVHAPTAAPPRHCDRRTNRRRQPAPPAARAARLAAGPARWPSSSASTSPRVRGHRARAAPSPAPTSSAPPPRSTAAAPAAPPAAGRRADRAARHAPARSPPRWRARSARSRTTTSARTIDIGRRTGLARGRERAGGRSPSACCRPRCCCKAVALAAREVPELNGFWVDGRFQPGTASTSASRSRCATAASSRRRSTTPTARALGRADARAARPRAARARRRAAQLGDGRRRRSPSRTSASRASRRVFGVIYPPQVALVGFGTVVRAPVGGGRHARRAAGRHRDARPPTTAPATATAAARFLAAVDRLLQEPEKL